MTRKAHKESVLSPVVYESHYAFNTTVFSESMIANIVYSAAINRSYPAWVGPN
jgi:hypothetical protein